MDSLSFYQRISLFPIESIRIVSLRIQSVVGNTFPSSFEKYYASLSLFMVSDEESTVNGIGVSL